MRGNEIATQRACPQCRRLTRFTRNALEWGGGDFVLVLVTLLVWIPIKILLNDMSNPWRCGTCGAKG